MVNYELAIVSLLLKKYYKRLTSASENPFKRRIMININKILNNYDSFDVCLDDKLSVNAAVETLVNHGFITVKYLKYSDDIEKIILNVDHITDLENYANANLGITPLSFLKEELFQLMTIYANKCDLVNFYTHQLKEIVLHSSNDIDIVKESDLLKALSFLGTNTTDLYIREASLFIYGDSKYLENNRKNQINQILMQYFASINLDVSDEDNLLPYFNVYDSDQQICIKGDVTITLANGNTLSTKGLNGGLSLSYKDIETITLIKIKDRKLMTVENKTSFLRLNDDYTYVYLGGFATKAQVSFLKKIIHDNPMIGYYHFGDIDAGGFWIHKKLCQQTGTNFHLFAMNKDELSNKQYHNYLLSLTENDVIRLTNLRDDVNYSDCIRYMLKHNVKLEQEIISYSISK